MDEVEKLKEQVLGGAVPDEALDAIAEAWWTEANRWSVTRNGQSNLGNRACARAVMARIVELAAATRSGARGR